MNNPAISRCYRWGQRLMVISLLSILSLISVMTLAVQPGLAQIPLETKEVHGQTKEQLTGRAQGEPLSAEERLDRAYSTSEAAGMREEKRQSEGKFDPREDNESLLEKARDAVERLTPN